MQTFAIDPGMFADPDFHAGYSETAEAFALIPPSDAVDLLPYYRGEQRGYNEKKAAGKPEAYAQGYAFGAWLFGVIAVSAAFLTPGTPTDPGLYVLRVGRVLGLWQVDDAGDTGPGFAAWNLEGFGSPLEWLECDGYRLFPKEDD